MGEKQVFSRECSGALGCIGTSKLGEEANSIF